MELEFDQKNSNIESSSLSNMLRLSIEKPLYSIDRFEENFAVCENLSTGEFINIDKNLLPINAKEGTIIKFENNIYVIDTQKTEEKQEEIASMVNSLFKRKE